LVKKMKLIAYQLHMVILALIRALCGSSAISDNGPLLRDFVSVTYYDRLSQDHDADVDPDASGAGMARKLREFRTFGDIEDHCSHTDRTCRADAH